jgi:hypothetical protein
MGKTQKLSRLKIAKHLWVMRQGAWPCGFDYLITNHV